MRRCLDPEPARRYQEAAHLAEDLQRELDHLPLRHAAEPSLAGRVRKWAQRHPALSSGGSIAVISIVLVISLAYVTLLVGSHLASYDVERRWIKFQEGLIRAQLLTHTGGETGIDLAKAERTCEATLAIFDVLRDANWARSRRMARLDQPKRRQVLEVLGTQELSVNEIVERLGWSQPMVSKHLGVLKQVNLL